jgi:hypothetical protein
MIVRCLLLVLLVLIALLFPWWCTLVAIAVYARYYVGVEVVLIMILIDAVLGTLYSSPLLTMGAVAVLLCMTLIRPRLRSQA